MEQDDLVSQFQAITNENADRSRFYLEAVNWDLNAALGSFYDNSGDAMMEEPVQDLRRSPSSAFHASAGATGQDVEKREEPTDRDKKDTASSASRRFHSLSDYQKDKQGDDSEEEGQEFYAGSEHSGEVIVGPGKKRGEDLVKKIFKSAKKHGAVEMEGATSSMNQKTDASFFAGSGYKLGEKQDDHQLIQGQQKPETGRQLDVVLKLWKDGFTIDDGPLRPYHDEQSKEFLHAVAKGEIPQELLRLAKGGKVNVDMEDHKHEDYKPVKKKMIAFTGQGRALGSVTPTVVSTPSPETAQSTSTPVDPGVIIDADSPITTVRLQLGDGQRITQKFNHHHTVAQIYAFVRARDRDQANVRLFKLMTTFPNKELKEDDTTLKAGNLLNAVIVQRFI